MKTVLAIAAALAVFAGPLPAGATDPTPPSPPPAPEKPSSTVSGVTVQALPRKPCAPKDKDCVAIVMAQVKELYPEQLKQFCFRENMDVMKQNMQAELAGWCDNPFSGGEQLCHRHVSPVIKQVCAPDKTAAKADARK